MSTPLSTASKIYLVTGASRGLGLEIVRQLSSTEGNFIFAGVRNPDSSTELKAIQEKSHGRVEVIPLDVSDQKSIESAAESLKKKTKRIDILINNAGIVNGPIDKEHKAKAHEVDPRDLAYVFQTNVIGVHLVTQAILPLLEAAKKGDVKDGKYDTKSTDVPKVINVSSTMASIANNKGGSTAYRVSKTALNMLTSCWHLDNPGIAHIPIHPGWVETDAGSSFGKPPLSVEQSIKGVLNEVHKATLETSGKFVVYDGTTLPW